MGRPHVAIWAETRYQLSINGDYRPMPDTGRIGPRAALEGTLRSPARRYTEQAFQWESQRATPVTPLNATDYRVR